ncbi:MAG TPA: hypothetical protein VMR50_11520 [Myxococcota bacterium]|nr:hypothetical protein [Myxococcota bacterium]
MALAPEQDLVLLAAPRREGGLEVEVAQSRLVHRRRDHGLDLRVVAVVVARDVLRVGQEHHEHGHAVLLRAGRDVLQRGAHRLPAARAVAIVAGPVVLDERAAALVLHAELRGGRDAHLAELLLQGAARALQERAQIQMGGELVDLEQDRMQRTERRALLILVELVVRVVHRIEVHEHEIR